MPLYQPARETAGDLEPAGPRFHVQVGPRQEEAQLLQGVGDSTAVAERRPRVLFVESRQYFDRPGIYGEGGGDYGDNARRYAFFALAALSGLPQVIGPPLVLHSHDWHAALAPVYLRTLLQHRAYYRHVATVLSVHNAGYQGHYGPETMPD
jgi:starch synthase